MELSSSVGQSLLPSLLQCFGTILIGYMFGRFGVLGSHGVKGLSIFVQYLSLPALVFTTISTIPFSNVNWSFIASVFVSKVIVFLSVVLMTIILTSPTDLGRSGIFAIAATQSNDFALGYPLLMSLYAQNHIEYPAFIYIIAPIQLLILNTVGFFLLEMDKLKHEPTYRQRYFLLRILKGTFKNPIVFMTVLGLISNITFGHRELPLFGELLKSFSLAFSATALFLLGYTIAGKSASIDKQFSLASALLVLSKNLMLPIIMQRVSRFMMQGSSEKTVQDLSSLGFLYGTLPTAPTAFVFASQYEVAVDVVSTTVIFSTVFAAPMMFASASMISLTQYGFENIKFYLSQAISFVSCINLLCCIWLLFVFLIGKRWHIISFGATIYLIFAQFLCSIGGIILFFNESNSTLFFVQFTLTNGGMFATRMSTVFLAGLLLIMKWRSLCFILKTRNRVNTIGFSMCFLLSFIAAGGLLKSKWGSDASPNFQLGNNTQVATTFAITLFCLSSTILCLIFQHMCNKNKHKRNSQALIQENHVINDNLDDNCCANSSANCKTENIPCSSGDEITVDVEDLGTRNCQYHQESGCLLSSQPYRVMCDSQQHCNISKKRHCAALISRYNKDLPNYVTGLCDKHLIFRHLVLLLALSASMMISAAVCLWKLVMESTTGIFIELEFLDIILNYSQGVMCFVIFGLDSELLDPMRKTWRKLIHGSNRLILPDIKDLPFHTVNICKQFIDHHYETCREEIGQTKTINEFQHNYAFTGCELVDWLLEVGLAKKRNKAEDYGRQLLHGRIIEHFDGCEEFCDNMYIYQFTDDNIPEIQDSS